MSEYGGLTHAAAEELPLARAFVDLQCVNRRNGAELGGPDNAESELIAELMAEKMNRKTQRTRRRPRSPTSLSSLAP